jgi:MraZ protein
MLLGSFKYSIDSKGRVSIPAKMRKFIDPKANNAFVMTVGTEKCIDVYPMNLWEDVVQNLDQLNQFDPKDARFMRLFLQYASDDKLDSQFRLLIPKNLLEYADISKEVLILGAHKKIELWNPQDYEDYLKANDLPYLEVAKQVMAANK